MAINVMLIEEDSAYADLIGNALVTHNFCVEYASNSLIGLRMARKIHLDMILIDLQVSDLEGNVLVLQLCKFSCGKRIPIIAFTSECGSKAKYLTTALLCDDLISKPVDTQQLPQQLTQVMARVATRARR